MPLVRETAAIDTRSTRSREWNVIPHREMSQDRSGGQRRRLLLARALVSSDRVLLLDEPTEHLDADAGADLLRRLLARDGGLVSAQRTVVVVTHQLPQDTSADLVIRVEKAESENALPTP